MKKLAQRNIKKYKLKTKKAFQKRFRVVSKNLFNRYSFVYR